VGIAGTGSGSRWRDRMLRTTSAELNPAGERFGAGRLDSHQPVGQHRRQDLDHLAVAVIRAPQLAPDPADARVREVLVRLTVPAYPEDAN
jgi:hypothetical protein